MFVVLYCHNQECTDFSYSITETFHQDEGSSERGTFNNADEFRQYVKEHMGSVEHLTLDLIEEGLESLQYTQEALTKIAVSMTLQSTNPVPLVDKHPL